MYAIQPTATALAAVPSTTPILFRRRPRGAPCDTASPALEAVSARALRGALGPADRLGGGTVTARARPSSTVASRAVRKRCAGSRFTHRANHASKAGPNDT